MAFCEITNDNLKTLAQVVVKRLKSDVNKAKNLKDFSNEMFQFFMSKNATQEKAVALTSYLPEIVAQYANDSRETRKLFKDNKISIDDIYDLEDKYFSDYDKLSSYLGLENSNPIQLVTKEQQDNLDLIDKAIKPASFEGRQRVIDGTKFNNRVTDIARAGFNVEDEDDGSDSAALVHGNTIDAIAKDIFDDKQPEYKDYATRIDEKSFNTLLGNLNQVKQALEEQGFQFRTGVTVYNKDSSIAGEIDLLGVNKEGEIKIFDFKSSSFRPTTAYFEKRERLGANGEIEGLSKQEQYSTQGYIYSKLLSDMIGKPVSEDVTIIAIPIVYNPTSVASITGVNDIVIKEFSKKNIREEYKDKSVKEIVDKAKELQEAMNKEVPNSITPVKNTRERKTFNTTYKPLDRIARANEVAASQPELQRQVDDVNRMFGDTTFVRLLDVIDTGLFGQFKLDGITIFKNASTGTPYHEGWHRFSQLFLSHKEKSDLYTDIRKKAIDFTTRDGRNLNTKDANFLDIEEFLAEEFAKFALDNKGYKFPKGNVVKNIFQKIWDFLKHFFSGNSAIDYFEQLYEGKLQQYTPSVDNAYWSSLNSSASGFDNSLISNERLPLYKDSFDALLSEELEKNGKTFTAFKQSKVLQKRTIENILDILNKRYSAEDNTDPKSPNYLTDQQFQEHYNILSNQREFINVMLKSSDYDTLRNTQIDDDVFSTSLDDLTSIEAMKEDYDIYDDGDEDNIDDAAKPDSDKFDRGGNEESAHSYADDAIKDFFRTIPKIKKVNNDGSVEYFTNELGYKQNHKAYDIFYKTKKMLEGAYGLDQIITALTDPNNHRKFPELRIIAERFLNTLNNSNETNKFRVIQNEIFIQNFTHAMELPHVNNMQLFVNYRGLGKKTIKNTSTSYKKLFRSIALKIIKNWSKNFNDRRNKTSLTISDNFKPFADSTLENSIFISSSGKVFLNPYVDYNTVFPGNNPTIIKQFFNLIGINLNDKIYTDKDAVNALANLKNDFVAQLNMYRAYADDNLAALVSEIGKNSGIASDNIEEVINSIPSDSMEDVLSMLFISDPISFFSEKRKLGDVETKALKYQFEDISEFEEMYGDLVSSGSFSVEGKTKYPFYRPNQMLLVTGMLNRINNASDFWNNAYLSKINPLSQPWMKRSFFLQNMYDIRDKELTRRKDGQGRPIELIVEDISSFKELDGFNAIEKTSASLNQVDKLFFDVLTFLNSGAIEVPRAETSPTTFAVRLSRYKDSIYPMSPAKLNSFENTDFQQILRDQFLGELERRLWYANNDPSFTANKKKFSEVFNVYEGILSKELKDKIMEVVNSNDKFKKGESIDDLFKEKFDDANTIRQKFEQETSDYFTKRTAEVSAIFRKLSPQQQAVIGDTLSGAYSPIKVAKAFVANRFIMQTEYSNLVFGDLYYYKNPYKRGKASTNNGTPMFIDEVRNMRMNKIQFQTLQSVVNGQSAPLFRDFRYLKSGTISDVEMSSAYVSSNDEDNRMLQDLKNYYRETGELTDTNEKEFVQGLKDSITSKYEKINIADGQGLVSLDFYRNFAISVGIWDAETHEREYDRQVAIFRRDNNLYFEGTEKGVKIPLTGDALEIVKNRDAELIEKGPFAFFNPLKLSYTGPDGKAGPMSPVFDKFSLRPVIPEAAIKGTRDYNMLMKMATEGVDYLKFESGTKAYVHPTFDWIQKASKGEYDLTNFDFEFNEPQTLYSAYLKHQLNTDGVKKDTIFSSQFRKIVYDVMYTPSVMNSKEATSFFQKQYDNYLNLVKEAISIEEKDLFNTLGIEVRGDDSYYISDFKGFIGMLRDESIKRKLPVNNINYLEYDEATRKFKYPIDFAFNRSQITDLLSGIMDERLRRLKLNGTQAIQVSSAGYENATTVFQKPTMEQIKKYGTNGLHYYHLEYDDKGAVKGTSTMGVKVGFTDNFKPLLKIIHPDGNKIETSNKEESLRRLNEALRNDNWRKLHKNKLIMVGYRIPVQNNNFIDRMEVMEFLPESAGAIIIPPIELIIKSGSDFDIDKMNILLRSLDRDTGKAYVRPEMSIDEIDSKIKEITFDLREYKSVQKQWKDIKKSTNIEYESLRELRTKIRNTIQLALYYERGEDLIDGIKPRKLSNEMVDYDREITNFSDAEKLLQDNPPNLNKAILDFYQIEKEIDNVLEKYTEADKNIDDKFQKLSRMKQRLKGAIANELISNLSNTIGSSHYFPLLVSPSTASIIDGMANEMVAATNDLPTPKDGEVLYDASKTAEENSRYTTNLETHDNFLSKRKDLGGYAIHRTWSSIFNKIKFSIAEVYVNKKEETLRVPIPLIPINDRNKVIEDGRVKMYGQSVTGIPIRNMYDQLQSATIDIANSPAYPYTGINKYNKQVFTYLIHQQVDPKVATWFINQPILKKAYDLFEKKSPVVKGYSFKHAMVETAIQSGMFRDIFDKWGNPKYSITKIYGKKRVKNEDGEEVNGVDMTIANPFLARPGDDAVEYINNNDEFTFLMLDEAIREKARNDKEGNTTRTSTPLQQKVLAYFMFSQERAKDVSQIQFAYNTDTTKYSTLPTIIRNKNMKNEVRKNPLFEHSQIEAIEKDSMIAPFDYTKKAKKILQTIFPILYKSEVVDSFSQTLSNITGRNIVLEKAAKIIENDYIEFIYKNFGEFQGKNIFDTFQPLAINMDNTSDHEFMSSKLLNIKSKYPELLQIPFVDALDEDAYFPSIELEDGFMYNGQILDNVEQRNILLNRSVDNSTFEKDIFTSNWNNLIRFNPEALGLKKQYSSQEISEISNFFGQLVYFSLYQSGLTNTGNGFSDLIPYQEWTTFIQNAFTKFDNFIKQNDANLQSLLSNFENLVIKMNPKINWRVTEEADGIDPRTGEAKTKPMRMYRNYYKGKQYRINDSEMGYVAHMGDNDEVKIDDSFKKGEENKEIKLEIGRYVTYKGETYIVTKQNKNTTWQIYNPSKEGKNAKKSVSERNIELRPEAGRVVGYKQGNYIVTPNNSIISLTTNKILSYPENHPDRKGILESKQAPIEDPNIEPPLDLDCGDAAPF